MPCVVFKDKQGRRIEVTLDKERVSVGREAGNDVVIPFRSVSRHHCVFATKADGVYVSDVGSSNGSRLNDAPLEGEQRLKDRDHLTIGEFRIRFYDRSKYADRSLSMEATQSVVLFGKEVARPVTKDAPAPAAEDTQEGSVVSGGMSPLKIGIALVAAMAAGAVVVAAAVIIMIRAGVLKLD